MFFDLSLQIAITNAFVNNL